MNVHAVIATVFGAGRFPVAPGTVGSLVAAALAWPLAWYCGGWWLAAFGLGVGLIAIPISASYARRVGDSDPPSCVIDEVAGQWIALAPAPLSPVGFAAGFVLFRLFDIVKPWPANKAQDLPGGLGIVGDDIVAGIMAAIAVYLMSMGGYL